MSRPYSVYPNAYDGNDQLPLAIDNITPVNAEVVNRIIDSVKAVESELGLKPSGTYATVTDRLDALVLGPGGSNAVIYYNNSLSPTNASIKSNREAVPDSFWGYEITQSTMDDLYLSISNTNLGSNYAFFTSMPSVVLRGTGSSILGGFNNNIGSSVYGTAAIASSVTGGFSNSAEGDFSEASGIASLARYTGQKSHSGAFVPIAYGNKRGTFQTSLLTLNGIMSGSGFNEINIALSENIIFPVNSIYGFEITLVATDLITNDSAVWKFNGAVKTDGLTSSFVGGIVNKQALSDIYSWDAKVEVGTGIFAIYPDDSTNYLKISVSAANGVLVNGRIVLTELKSPY